MANTVIAIRSSGTAAATPSLGVIANGEISLNYADGIIYYKTASNTLGSIRTTQPAGLTTEVQFNDAGSFGSNASLTFNKTLATLNVKNINVSTNLIATTANLTVNSITTGTGVGGIIAGANVIYSNTFIANTGGITTAGNSSLNGIVTVNYINATSTSNVAIEMYGANTKGGTGYFDFLAANNRSAGTTNPNKVFRLDSNGKFQIINSAYTVNIFDLNDSGYLTIPGALATSQYIQFSDGSKQYTANAGGGSLSNTQILAGLQTVSPTANITFDTMILANNNNGRNLRIGDDAWIGDVNLADTLAIRGAFSAANAYIVFGNADATSLGRAGAGALTYGGNTIWHAGNDGSGSGLDADTVDGLDSASFANAAFANTVTAFARGGTNATSYTTGTFLTSNGTAFVSVANTGTAGTYANAAYVPVITTDAYGRVSSITNTAISIDTSQLASGTIADARLPTKGTAGTYGNTTYIPVLTTDAYGRVTGVTNTAIQSATTSVQGIVQLTDSISSTSTTTAATPNSVKNSYDLATTANTNAVNAGTYANSAFDKANSANVLAQAAYNNSNTKFSSSGGTITGDTTVTGNLTISGNLTSISANNIVIDDSIIYLANNNTANVSDIGFVGHFTDSKYQHTGLVRDASDGRWKLFSNVTAEPATTVDFTLAVYDTLQIGRLESTTANVSTTIYTGNVNVTTTVDWPAAGTGAPTFTTRSAGTKLLLYPAISGSQADYAMGIDSATLWSSVPVNSSSFYFKWYGGTTNVTSLDGTGAFTTRTINVYSTTASTSNITGALIVGGGVGVKGNVAADGIIFPDNTRQTTAATGGASIGDVLALAIALG